RAGQIGKGIALQLYIAVCISGAVQNVAGVDNRNVITAIDEDGDMLIYQAADVGLVGNLFEEISKLS
ncbi:hypothetical protein COCMIDRAFT_96927, partial [Bipolaris oryzae ATCC 44560]